jgi:hypothetical protein
MGNKYLPALNRWIITNSCFARPPVNSKAPNVAIYSIKDISVTGHRQELDSDVARQGIFMLSRLYGPTNAFVDKAWKPGDLHRQ